MADRMALFNPIGKPQLTLPLRSGDPTLVEQLRHYLDSSYASHLSDDDKLSVLKQFWELLVHAADKLSVVSLAEANDLFALLAKQMEAGFSQAKDGSLAVDHRRCRYTINTLLEMYKSEMLAQAGKQESADTRARMHMILLLCWPDVCL